MKKSKSVILSSVFFVAISACNNHKDEWTDGKDANGHMHDTAVYHNGSYYYYRYYGGGWYPLRRNNLINTGEMAPFSSNEISSPAFSPRSASGSIRSGGFGGSAGESAGE